jgi:hypothetical protein
MRVGGLPATIRVLLCERWCLHAFYGVYGGKEITKVLKTYERTLEEIKSLFSYTLYLWTAAFFIYKLS